MSGDLIFVAGQGPFSPDSDDPVGHDIASQTRKTLENVSLILEECGASLDEIVKTTVYLNQLDDFDGFDRTYRQVLSPPFPARATVGCALPGFRIEMDVVARAPTPT